MRTAGFWPPAMETRPTPESCEIFCARTVSARSSTFCSGTVSEVSDEREDGRVGRVDLGVDGRVGQVLREVGVGGVDGGLHVLLGDVDGLGERELERDDGAATGGDGGHLLQAGDLAELALERTGDGLRHDVGAGAGIVGLDLDDRVVDLRQRGDRQLQLRDEARKQNGHHQERGGHRPKNKWP